MGWAKDLLIFCENHGLDPMAPASREAWWRGWVDPDVSDGRDLDWEEVAAFTNGRVGVTHAKCPYCRRVGTFKIDRVSLTYAQWKCFYCGKAGAARADGPIDPVAELEARRRADEREEADRARRIADAMRLWEQTERLSTVALTYLNARSIFDLPPNVDESLRWHPSCPFGRGVRRPAIVALMRDVVTDAPVAIHRTAIADAKAGKAVDERMVLGPMRNVAIKLWPLDDTGRLVAGEGWETVLSAAGCAALERMVGEPLRPAWAFGVAGNLKAFPVIPGVRRLLVLEDNDVTGTGQEAARAVRNRWRAAGRTCAVLKTSKPGTDFNDLVRELNHG